MRKYRHKQSGAIFSTDKEMPARDWELLDGGEKKQEKPAEAPKRSRTRKKTTPKE